MRREVDKKTPAAPKISHSCSKQCLGPLTFHPQAVGHKIRLSEGCRRADRSENTFNGGLVFSNRPVRTCERIRVQILKRTPQWKGAVRVGFTNVPPSGRSRPLPRMAMPNLTDTPGHWAIPVHESRCGEGSVLEFWVSSQGYIHVKPHNGRRKNYLIKVDLHQPLWAMIDVYGQTSSIFLQGSEKKELLSTRRSCPAPDPLIRPPCSFNHDYKAPSKKSDFIPFLDMEVPAAANSCVVCMARETDTTLSCGHRCLCTQCTSRILREFGTCPLCRLKIDTIIDEEVTVF
ncbi:E3 ubiquitin-protein ligase NEURL3-like isoform X1 [Cyprinodon tularosa]|uniref:E3 ubiquitin-protein ligase NEURL3-like isoform X1 n=1 Tax=Cyprinodon tularosa TaxID=77115 RepID=UPI0018E28092|nr:E3 ubiquitin-protein ligase NEURL3-like isoform X1 [Cyprinodon tularosa]XP_038141604.1 E3 ubiquitin-protein ligase NEURL3-like isoform X1 [Cyprinodon tularosa]